MRFYVKQQRKPSIIIIALIDILVILLIFFVVSTTFVQQPAVQLTLPKSKSGQEMAQEQGLVLTISADQQMFLNLAPVKVAELTAKLQSAKKQNPNVTLELRADEKVAYGMIIKVMDASKEANIETVNAFIERPSSGPQ